MLRAPREKNLPQKASIMLPNCLFQLPFPLLLNAENGIFMITTVSSAHLGPAQDALLKQPWPLNQELVPLCHSFQSGCFLESTALTTLHKAVLPKYTGLSMHVPPPPPPLATLTPYPLPPNQDT